MKILHILDHSIPLHSGYTFRTRAILREQAARGWQTAHITSPKHSAEGPDPETVDGLTFYRSQGRGGVWNLPVLDQLDVVNGLVKRLREVIDIERPDILHAHSPALNGLAALRVGRERGLPVVYECRAFWEDAAVDHGTTREGSLRYRVTRALESKVFREADAVTCICEGLRRDIVDRGVSADKVTVIPNAVDIEDFQAGVARDEALATRLGLGGGPVLGFIGSFYAYEGLPLAVEAYERLRHAYPDARLLLVGGGPQEPLLHEQVERMGLRDVVIFTGRVPHAEVQRYYDLVDIFLYPRLPMRLTDLVTPLKPLEAMAQRRLVVASDVGGHRELIKPGENGLLFSAGDAAALAETVSGLLTHRERWPQLQANGRRFVEEERNWANSVANYEQVYGGITG